MKLQRNTGELQGQEDFFPPFLLFGEMFVKCCAPHNSKLNDVDFYYSFSVMHVLKHNAI